jgi:hypothetical protein
VNVTARPTRTRRAAFVIPHPYVDALACFREPIKRLADEGWQVELFTTLSPMHPAPAFNRENVRLVPIEMTRLGAVRLVAELVRTRPKYDWLFAVPQWSLHYTSLAASLANIPMVCISDELKAEEEATSDVLKRWKHRERRAHQKCTFTIALSDPRAAFIRDEDCLGPDHPIVTVPNAAPGPAGRLVSHYYQDVLGIACDKRILLHAGSWWWKRQFGDLEDVACGWGESNVLVFQGRIQNHFPASAPHPNLRFNSTVLPSDLLDYAVSSAHIGLALYDTRIANNRLMGTASGKITLYMKNMLPVIATANPSFDWIEREGCGVLVKDLRDIGAAVDHIRNHYDDYVRNVKRFYDDTLDFTKRFASVCTLMNHV